MPAVIPKRRWLVWIQNDTDWFVDLTARHFWVHTDLDNIFSNDGINAYDIKRNFWAFSAETGRPFEWNAPDFINVGSSVISVEPKFELRYVRGGAKNFRTDNGETGRVNKAQNQRGNFLSSWGFIMNGLDGRSCDLPMST